MDKIEYRISINNAAGGMAGFQVQMHVWGTGQVVLGPSDLPADGSYRCFEVDKLDVTTKLSLSGPNNYAHVVEVRLDKSEDFPFLFLNCDADLDMPPAKAGLASTSPELDAPELDEPDQDTRADKLIALDLGCSQVNVRVVDSKNKPLAGYAAHLRLAALAPLTGQKPTDQNGQRGATFTIRETRHHLGAEIFKAGAFVAKTRVYLRKNTANVVTFVMPDE